MIAVVIALMVIEIALFVFLHLRIKEISSHVDTLQSQIYRTSKGLDEFSRICMNRHSANRGIDFPNTRTDDVRDAIRKGGRY